LMNSPVLRMTPAVYSPQRRGGAEIGVRYQVSGVRVLQAPGTWNLTPALLCASAVETLILRCCWLARHSRRGRHNLCGLDGVEQGERLFQIRLPLILNPVLVRTVTIGSALPVLTI